MKSLFYTDFYRMTGKKMSFRNFFYVFFDYQLRYLKVLRKKRKNFFDKCFMKKYEEKYGLQILAKDIGKGLYLCHAHNINVNPNAKLGNNINLNKGCTIGQENRGKRKGAPVIGNEVWIGSNAMVCGAVTIGSNVLIAPNSFVNFDVPDNSIVIGNPGLIKSSLYATDGYINNKV